MWTISQVSRMTGVPRKDIQRICDRNDRVFIFCPEESAPGKRYFSEDDVLKIVLVSQYKKMGYNLKDIQRAFLSFAEQNSTLEEIASSQIIELERKRREIDDQIEHAKDLKAVFIGGDRKEAAERILAARAIRASAGVLFSFLHDCVPELDASDLEEDLERALGSSIEDITNEILRTRDAFEQQDRSISPWVSTELRKLSNAFKRGSSPDSPEVSLSIGRLIRSMVNAEKDSTQETMEKAAWLVMIDVLDQTDVELIVELAQGQGSLEWVKTAFLDYGKRRWSSEEET